MTERQPTKQFSPEVRQRAVRMVLEHRGEHASERAAIGSIAARSAARRRRCAPGCARHGARRASTPAPARRSASGSARWNARCANRARPTRYCARHQRILPRRSSTAGSSHRRQRRRSGSARKPVPRAPAGIAFILALRPGRNAIRRRASRSAACSRRISASMACARCGGSSGARASRSPAARSRG